MKEKNITTILKWTFLSFLVIFELFPLVQVLLNSFRADKDIKSMPLGFPKEWVFTNFQETWVKGGYTVAFINSIVVGAVCIFVVTLFAGACGYALSKMEFKSKGFFTAYFMIAISLPGFLYIVPDYFMFNALGLTNSRLGITIIYSAMQLPFNMLLIRTFLIGIPKELEEAGKVDGCNEFTVFLRITMPLAKPILMTVALLVFANTWNEFLWANTFLQDDAVKTVATRFVKFTGEYTRDLSKIFTASVISILPIVGLYLVFQKNFIEGLTSGSVKG